MWGLGEPEICVGATGAARLSGGCEVAIDIEAPRTLEGLLAVTYASVVELLVNRLAKVAEAR